jgi:hypothetical protein
VFDGKRWVVGGLWVKEKLLLWELEGQRRIILKDWFLRGFGGIKRVTSKITHNLQ